MSLRDRFAAQEFTRVVQIVTTVAPMITHVEARKAFIKKPHALIFQTGTAASATKTATSHQAEANAPKVGTPA